MWTITPEPLCLHVRYHRLCQPQRSAEVDVHQLPEVLRRHAQRVAELEGADGVDQDVRWADLSGDPVHKGPGYGGVGGVGDLPANLVGSCFSPASLAVDSDDCQPGAMERQGGGRPNPLPAPATIAMECS